MFVGKSLHTIRKSSKKVTNLDVWKTISINNVVK